MTMMKTNLNTKIAIVQFGYKPREEEIKANSKILTRRGIVDWYFFDETADRDFEIAALRPHYDFIYECIDIENFKEIKNEKDI